MNQEIILFTDGSYMKKFNCAGFGVYFPNKEFIKIRGSIKKDPTNNKAELSAIYYGLNKLRNYKKYNIIVYSDSLYCIKSLTIWYKYWINNGWKTSKKTNVLNKNLIIKIIDLINFLKSNKNIIKFIHIKAHTLKNDFYSKCNEEVDKLAKSAILK